jgi:hypothetical protein
MSLLKELHDPWQLLSPRGLLRLQGQAASLRAGHRVKSKREDLSDPSAFSPAVLSRLGGVCAISVAGLMLVPLF